VAVVAGGGGARAPPNTAAPTLSPTAPPTISPAPTLSPTAPPTISSAPTRSPTDAPTESPFVELTGVGTAWTCVAETECPITWSASPSCASIRVKVFVDGALVDSGEEANDGAATQVVPQEAAVGASHEMVLVCVDDPSLTDAKHFAVSWTPAPTASPTDAPTASPTDAPTPDPTAEPTVFTIFVAPTVGPTAAPTPAPTDSFIEITAVGDGFTCVSLVECVVTWTYRGDPSACETVTLEFFQDGVLKDSETTANDGSTSEVVPGEAELTAHSMTIACDGGGPSDAADFDVSVTPAPSPEPTASFIEITAVGDGFTCVSLVECVVTWTYRGPADACATVTLEFFEDGVLKDAETTANDGTTSAVVPGEAEWTTHSMTIACDDVALADAKDFEVSVTPAPSPEPTVEPTPEPTSRPTSRPTGPTRRSSPLWTPPPSS
jgi:hypothetical protein